MINLIAKSLWNRKGTALLTLFSIAISVAPLIGVEPVSYTHLTLPTNLCV